MSIFEKVVSKYREHAPTGLGLEDGQEIAFVSVSVFLGGLAVLGGIHATHSTAEGVDIGLVTGLAMPHVGRLQDYLVRRHFDELEHESRDTAAMLDYACSVD